MKQFAAQAIVDFYTDWEEYYRSELARAHECDPDDFQIDYFGDLSNPGKTTFIIAACAAIRQPASD